MAFFFTYPVLVAFPEADFFREDRRIDVCFVLLVDGEDPAFALDVLDCFEDIGGNYGFVRKDPFMNASRPVTMRRRSIAVRTGELSDGPIRASV